MTGTSSGCLETTRGISKPEWEDLRSQPTQRLKRKVGGSVDLWCQGDLGGPRQKMYIGQGSPGLDDWHDVCCGQLLSRVRFFATPGTVACQAPLSLRLSRQEFGSGLPFPSSGDDVF